MESLLSLIRRRDFARAKARLALEVDESLARVWVEFKPLEKLLAFKLLEPGRALEFFAVLPFPEKYFLYGGAPLETIAPLLESLPAAERRLFHQMPKSSSEKMLRRLLDESGRTRDLEPSR